jgi:hypothetical protein
MLFVFGGLPLEDVVAQGEVVLLAHVCTHEGLHHLEKGGRPSHH